MAAVAAMIAMCAGVVGIYGSATDERIEQVPEQRLQRLTKGVNLSGWFWHKYDPWAYDDRKLQTIRDLGFLHVRLPIHSKNFYNENDPSSIPPIMLKKLDEAIEAILRHDLAVIVDFHADDGLKALIQLDPAHAKKAAQFWHSLAKHLSRFDPDRVFLEVINEPFADHPEDWYEAQRTIMAAMRQGAPKHTLVASANLKSGLTSDSSDGIHKIWNNVIALTQLEPLRDRNVVYNFHMYEPMTFTHQEAGWGWELLKYFKNVPYPSPELSACPAAAESTVMTPEKTREVQAALNQYCREGWNKEKIRAYIKPAVEWANRHNVRLTANEFGVFRQADARSRLQYLRDVREVFEEYGIGWAVWEYQEGFAVAPEGVPDRDAIKALSLDTVPGFWESAGMEVRL